MIHVKIYPDKTTFTSFSLFGEYVSDKRINLVKYEQLAGIFVGDKFESDIGTFKTDAGIPFGSLEAAYSVMLLITVGATIGFVFWYEDSRKWYALMFTIWFGLASLHTLYMFICFMFKFKISLPIFEVEHINFVNEVVEPQIDSYQRTEPNPPPYVYLPIEPAPPPYKEEGSV